MGYLLWQLIKLLYNIFMKYKFIFILLAIVVLTISTYVYLDRVFFPVKFKKIIEQKIAATLQRKTTIDKIDLNLWRGIVLTGVRVYEPNLSQPFIEAENLSLRILLPPFFKAQHIIIPSIRLKNLYLHLRSEEHTSE